MFSLDATQFDTEDAAVAVAKAARDEAFYVRLYAGATPEEIWADRDAQLVAGWRVVEA